MIYYSVWNAMGPEPDPIKLWACYDGTTPAAAAFDYAAANEDFGEAISMSGVYRVRDTATGKAWEVRIDVETEGLEGDAK